jgi:hypothetical protein
MKARILFSKGAEPVEVSNLKSFTVSQNNKISTVHVADFEKYGTKRRLTFFNLVEATMKGSRYVNAQSKLEFCAKLEILKDE